MSKGVYPLGVKKVLDEKKNSNDTSIRKATNRLFKFEQKLMGKEKKKRKRSRENCEEKAEVPRKRKKIDSLKNDNRNELLNDDDLTQKELAKFTKRSEGDTSKKIRKKKNIEKRKNKNDVNGKVLLNGDEVTEEELKNFIAQSERKLDRQIKKTKKNAVNKKVRVSGDDVTEELGKKGDRIVREQQIEDTVEMKAVNRKEKKLKRKIRDVSNDDKVAKRKKKNKEILHEVIIDNIECVFERNSGTWVVYDVSGDMEQVEISSQQTGMITI